ncbi:MAG: hypothetical protein LBH91_02420 [Prevotellaceae bacterium]|jgi:LEA14-like dessication related protein|nr:hypothetical protein [Prevotellaceae bacterium]
MKRIALFVALISITVACSKYKDISVEDAQYGNFSMQSTSKFTLTLDIKVNNPTKRKITITEGILDIFLQDRNVATLSVGAPTIIASKSNVYHQLLLNGTIKDFMALTGINFNNSDLLEQFDVEGFLKAKAGVAGKKINIERTSFKNLLQSL